MILFRKGTNEHPIKTYARDAATDIIGHQLANRNPRFSSNNYLFKIDCFPQWLANYYSTHESTQNSSSGNLSCREESPRRVECGCMPLRESTSCEERKKARMLSRSVVRPRRKVDLGSSASTLLLSSPLADPTSSEESG